MNAMKHDILNRIPEIKSENPELFAMRFESGLRVGNSDSKPEQGGTKTNMLLFNIFISCTLVSSDFIEELSY